MLKSAALPLLLSLVAGSAGAAQLTEMETRWLSASASVLSYAKQLKLPVDIVVQPEAGPNDVPLAMGFADGRCKLVLSMRGNPQAEAVLAGVPSGQQALLIEAMAAHEIGHCWRYAEGVWHALPAGFVEAPEDASTPELRKLARELRDTRREEGFSDLLALAWTQRQHPAQYAVVHSWLLRLRSEQPTEYGSHDTRAWLKLASDGQAFAAGETPFEQARALWSKGLLSD
ncbi:hypothetical protein MJ904_00835 [Massilia sp. MB5]|uniref:hypothetical protein n=1 Tax=unclassified Massilia TaxID=2609279 RepID=UPI00067B4178|nr:MULTISPECIES: hypothetical protein [unclassified Massilia]AKU24156.1 hypothetical protein ACZ75_24585 [Massilia sp. NR 4-1]UMR30852.1 hypothetical protein MJ904_00835 [Massilia sp. MB5]